MKRILAWITAPLVAVSMALCPISSAAPNEKTDAEMAQDYCDAIALLPNANGVKLASALVMNEVGNDANHAALIAYYALQYTCPQYFQIALDTYRQTNHNAEIHEKVS